ncbi:MAG: hypothetical protein CSB24_03520, partial [Deltaproteobacteria bacterium]
SSENGLPKCSQEELTFAGAANLFTFLYQYPASQIIMIVLNTMMIARILNFNPPTLLIFGVYDG